MKTFTQVIRSHLIIMLSIVFIFNQCIVTVIAEDTDENPIKEPEDLYALSAVLMDADSGRILFSKNGQEERAMASTTKIMTCILALENENLDKIVTASETAAAQPEVHLGVHSGQQFTLRDLMYSMMLESHNDSAVMIAEAIGQSIDGFADMMNQKALELGCKNTYFITPNGLDASDENGIHRTTAEDLAKIMKYCIMDSPQKEEFLKITQTQEYSFSDIENKNYYTCINRNAFLKMMSGALSGKTGFTNEAGYCYVGALENEKRTFIVALLACGWPNNKGYKWADTRNLMKYGIENYHYKNVYQQILLPSIEVIHGIPDGNKLQGPSTVSVKINPPHKINNSTGFHVLLRDDESVQITVEQKESLFAPVKENTPVGKIYYLLNGTEIASMKIVTAEKKEIRNIFWCSAYIFKQYFL